MPASLTRSKSTGQRSPAGSPIISPSTCRKRDALSRAVHMWLEAAKQSAERSANLEANAQLRRALEEIKKLPAGVERDNLELNIQIALIGPTIALQGFAAVAVADVSSRAIELCRALDDDPRIFPALYARWSYLRVAATCARPALWRRNF